ncbi:MAG: tryptophan synthase subunit alpha [Actinomycetota bacterium]|nr:tryptophan synthase subunit alpha [Actinomycetota bacterium]
MQQLQARSADDGTPRMTALLDHLETARSSGRKLLVPYMVAGIPDVAGFPEALATVARLADAVEVGLPYSDPLMDGPVIASASERALGSGVGPLAALELASSATTSCPRIAMTYYNPIHRVGESEFCRVASEAGFTGLIVPDIPVEESASLRSAVADHDLAWVPLVAPTSSTERVKAIAVTATGFIYAVSTLGVTGARTSLSERAAPVVAACRGASDLPVLVGIGVSTPEQAREAAVSADGVVVGSAVVRHALESGAEAAAEWLASVRAALDN